MSRIVIIVGGLVVLLLLALGAWFLFAPEPVTPSEGTPTNPFGGVLGGTETPRGSQHILTRSGEDAVVTSFTDGAPATPISIDPTDLQYDLTPYPDYVPGQPYPTHEFDIQFNSKTSEFLVTLNQEPLGHARIAAEAFLRTTLGVTNEALCALNVTIRVPYTVNETYANYRNLGPSTCQGAVKLP
jgi:hypothetical protein